MISPFPRSNVRRGPLVAPSVLNDVKTLTPSAPTESPSAADEQAAEALPFPDAKPGPKLKAPPPPPKPRKTRNKELTMREAPPLPPPPEDVAMQAAPAPDAQEAVMQDPEPVPEFHDASDMIGLNETSGAGSGTSPGLPAPASSADVAMVDTAIRSSGGAMRRTYPVRRRERVREPVEMVEEPVVTGWVPPSDSPTKDEIPMVEAAPSQPKGKGKAKKYSRKLTVPDSE
jgi:hypothetical protein